MNKLKKEEYLIPMEITLEVAKDFGIERKDLKVWKVGNQAKLVCMVPCTEEQYYEYMRPICREEKREERDREFLNRYGINTVSMDALYEDFNYEIAGHHNTENEVMRKMLLEKCNEFLATLEELEKEIIYLFLEDLSEAEIAKLVHVSQKTVNNRKK